MDFAYIVLVTASCLLQICLGQDPTSAEAVTFTIKITPESPVQNWEVGISRILTCQTTTADDNAVPVLHWEKDGQKIAADGGSDRMYVESLGPTTLRLRFENVENGDEGIYKCVGTLGAQMDSRSVQVEIYKALEINSPKEQFGILGETGLLKCDATGQPAPTITWKFGNGTAIKNTTDEPDKYTITPRQLAIKELTFEDAGDYLCDILVIDLGMGEAFYINYAVVKKPTINMQPTIKPNNPKVGDKVQITCVADGVPKPTYQFKRGDNLLPDNMVENGILTIESVSREDEATYTCIATNKGGSAEQSNTLDVKIVPMIDPIPDVTDALEDGQKQVICTAKGDPEPTVTWHKVGYPPYTDGTNDDGREIVMSPSTDNSNAEIKTVTSTMIFNPIKPQDAGEYVCTAFNSVGEVNRTIKFEVKYAPHFDTDFKERVFYGWSGHTANLTCQASANELAVIRFLKPNPDDVEDFSKATRIENEAPFTVTTTQRWEEYKLSSGSLLVSITGTDETLYGSYFCEADNSMGQKHQKITLKRANPPSQPTIQKKEIFSTMMIVDIKAPTDNGGQPVTSYLYNYRESGEPGDGKSGEIEKTGDLTPLELRDLEPSSNYRIEVKAKNNVGPGTAQTISLDTLAVSVPLKMVLNSPQIGTQPTSYKLKWQEVDDGGAPITAITVKYRKVNVEGEAPDSWIVVGDLDPDFTTVPVPGPKSSRSFTLQNLERDTYYEIRITAANSEGESPVEQRIVRTSKGADPVVTTTEGSRNKNEVNGGDDGDEEEEEEEDENVDPVGHPSGTEDPAGAGSLSSGAVIGIILGLIVFILLIVVIIYLVTKKKPELVGRLRGRLGGKGGEEERGTKEDGKDPAEEEKLIKKDDTVKVENETEGGKTGGDVIEEQPKEFEPENKPEAQAVPETEKKDEPAAEKPKDLSTPAPTTEIKITPETPEKPENPPA